MLTHEQIQKTGRLDWQLGKIRSEESETPAPLPPDKVKGEFHPEIATRRRKKIN